MSVDAKAPVESPEIKEILVRYRDVWAVYYGVALINWDMETYMPAGASAERGEARATLKKLVQRLLTHPEFVALVESAHPKNDFERGVIRVLKRDIEYFTLVRPELIRVEADEVHYGLHIYLRFEIERRVLEGELDVRELPEFWNAEMERLIGIGPRRYAEGVLQDVHWSLGYVGYFPTYFIGTVLSAQVASKIPNLSEKIAQRRFREIMGFLRERVQRWGSVYAPKELVRRALGEDLNPERFLDYVRAKYARTGG